MASFGSVVSARGAQRRIQALVARGWSQQRLADALGVKCSTIFMLMSREGVRTSRHLEVVALYELMWNVAPPMEWRWDRAAATRSMNHARAEGWLPPLAWDDLDADDTPAVAAPDDDIDDVAVDLATAGEDVRLTAAERREAVRRLNSLHYSDNEIAARLRITARAVLRIRSGAEIPAARTAGRDLAVA